MWRHSGKKILIHQPISMKFCMCVLGQLKKILTWVWRHRRIQIFIYQPISMKFCMCVLGRLKIFFDMSVTSSEHQNFYIPTDFNEILSVWPRSTKKMFAMSVTSSEHQNLYLPTDFDTIWYVCTSSIKKKFRHECDVIGGSKSLFTYRFWLNFIWVFLGD